MTLFHPFNLFGVHALWYSPKIASLSSYILQIQYLADVSNSGCFSKDTYHLRLFRANTSDSNSELLARRFLPCTPLQLVSPQAYNPFIEVRLSQINFNAAHKIMLRRNNRDWLFAWIISLIHDNADIYSGNALRIVSLPQTDAYPPRHNSVPSFSICA